MSPRDKPRVRTLPGTSLVVLFALFTVTIPGAGSVPEHRGKSVFTAQPSRLAARI
ncbi:MAG: hypothetical protein SNJ63_03810 [Sphingomonadaceae bacterium]